MHPSLFNTRWLPVRPASPPSGARSLPYIVALRPRATKRSGKEGD